MIDISLLCIRHLLCHSELRLIGQILELFTLAFLILSFHYVGIDVGSELCEQVFSILFGTLVHFGKGQSRMLPHCEDVVTQVSYKKAAELIVLRLGLFWESGHKGAACNASCVSHWPALILEAVYECLK